MDDSPGAGSSMIALRATGVVAAVLVVALAAVTDGEARTHLEGRTTVPSIVARVLPAVVSITTRRIEPDEFNQPVPTRGLGSGFIFDRRGYILTNNHVVEVSWRSSTVGSQPWSRPAPGSV